MPKLFLYKAKNANIVAILRRSCKRSEWQLIKWNIETDTFEMGQWLKGKMIHPRYSAISPDGNYFFYHYWDRCQYSEDAVFSKLPNFTAEYYGKWNTYYSSCSFTEDSKGVISLPEQFQMRKETNLKLVLRNEADPEKIVSEGYIGKRNHKNEFLDSDGKMNLDDTLKNTYEKFDEYYEKYATFIDCKGRSITIKEEILYANGEVLLDTTNHKFECIKPKI